MGIVFYSHRVSYPNLLSAQVLPSELRGEAVRRLMVVRDQVDDYPMVLKNSLLGKITKQQINDNINYLMAKDQSHLWPDFIEFNRRLDATRNQNLLEVYPEFKLYV
jgi:hypothetical protein